MESAVQKAEGCHSKSIEETLLQVGSSVDGLTEERAKELLHEVGPNELIETHRRHPWKIFLEQLTSTMVLILIGASVLSIIIGSHSDAWAILAIVVLFSVLGFLQDFRAEKAMAALKKMAVPIVRALRSGKVIETSTGNLVPGDVILIETGNIIPADCRLLQSVNLKIQESALTGESEPVTKNAADICPVKKPLAERSNMVYMGTIVVYGRASAVIVETGMKTELGKIASILQNVKQTGTPLQRRLDSLGKTLALIGIAISLSIIVIGLLRGEKLSQLIMAGISVAVAVIPEGLPAVVTITLAIGAQRMLKHKSLIRKLPAVETLGSVTVICSDKTGTLTQNKMSVVCLDLLNGRVEFRPEIKDNPQAMLAATAAALCNDAILTGHEEFVGDPTEGALLVAASRLGLKQEVLQQRFSRIAEIPFDSERKRMTTIHRMGDHSLAGIPLDPQMPAIAFVKGSADGLLDICTGVMKDSVRVAMTPEIRRQIQQSNEQMASSGFRVLGTAYKLMPLPVEPLESNNIENELVFAGLIGMIDPPRMEVKDSVGLCKSAGIRPIMITGDHPLTARYIADQIGILNHGKVMTGVELESMSVDELLGIVEDVSVYARVSPEHKLKIIEALQKKGQIVAMTGDGVNDAPALKQADIGVAMGITGTDVSKEASDMVLLDDNFTTIVHAVEEGRIVYDNIRKFVKFSVAGNIGKVLVMLAGPFIFDKLPLLPLQLLWLNLLTDGLLGLALGMEKGESNIMQRPPIAPKEGVFGNGGWMQVFIMGTAIGLLSTGVGYWYYRKDDASWQTMIFLTIGFCQVWQILTARSEKDSFLRAGLFSNKTAVGMILTVVALQLSAVYIPVVSGYLKIERVGFDYVGIALAAGAVVLAVGEIRKKFSR